MIQRTSKFLMANLGAEVERIFYWKEKKDLRMLAAACNRAKTIIGQIMECPDMPARAQEIKILGDVINDLINELPEYNIFPVHLQNYFAPFVKNTLGHLS